MTKDRRGWWTGAIAIVFAFWTFVLLTLPRHYDLDDHAVFARIAFMHSHDGTELAMTVAVLSMLVAYAATFAHLIGVLRLRKARVIPRSSSLIVTLVAIVMVVSTALYMAGMADFGAAHVRWVLPAELASAVVLAVAGVVSCGIARRDHERLLLAPFPPRGRLGGVEPRGGQHERRGAGERSHPE